jgi:hypothetical protein
MRFQAMGQLAFNLYSPTSKSRKMIFLGVGMNESPVNSRPHTTCDEYSRPGAARFFAALSLRLGLPLPGVRLVTWNILAVINWCFDCKIT